MERSLINVSECDSYFALLRRLLPLTPTLSPCR